MHVTVNNRIQMFREEFVPQDSVSGLLLFFIYTNHVRTGMTSIIRLSMTAACCTVSLSEYDSKELQGDINEVPSSCNRYRMALNCDICYSLRFTRKRAHRAI